MNCLRGVQSTYSEEALMGKREEVYDSRSSIMIISCSLFALNNWWQVYLLCNFGCMLSVGATSPYPKNLAQKRWDRGRFVGILIHDMPCTWRLSWLAIERPWLALAGPSVSFLAQTGVETSPLPFHVLHFGFRRQFAGQRALIIVSLLMTRCVWGHETQENWWQNHGSSVQC